jgi:hypothetical protein
MIGFLGTGATFAADLNLVIQVLMGAALILGGFLARWKHYRAHAVCQTTVLVLNLSMIALVMWPSLHAQVLPGLSRHFATPYYAVAAAHGALGAVAELFGLYIALMAGTRVVPQRLRLRNWKFWMRAELALWWVVILTGAGTYYSWYLAH